MPTQKQLADTLGLDPAEVSRSARRGMPTHSVEAARAWRLANVRPYARPVSREGFDADEALQRIERLAVMDGDDALRAAVDLGRLGAELAARGRFPAIAGPLRAVLASIPERLRPAVKLPASVWCRLTREVALRAEGSAPDGPAPGGPDDALLAAPDDEFGRAVYSIASGELRAS